MMTTTRWLGALACCIVAGSALAQQIGWQYKNGNAKDIGVGADGTVWVISSGGVGGGNYKIYRYDKGNWVQAPGGAVRIDVGPDGKPYVVNYAHEIYHWNGKGWDKLDGQGLDIGVGADGTVWLIGTDWSIWRRDARAGWQKMPGRAVRVDVDPKGNAWVVNELNDIYRWDPSINNWVNVPGKGIDIGVGSEGSVWVAGLDGAVWKYNGYDWSKADGNLVNITVDNHGNPWGVNRSDQIWGASNGAAFQLPLARPPQGAAPQAILPADQEGYIFTYNRSRYASWVTLYKNIPPLTKIVDSACVPSNGAKLWRTELSNSLSYSLRAELMLDDNCHSPVLCDTKVKIDSFNPIALYNYATLSAPQGCWWDVSVKRR